MKRKHPPLFRIVEQGAPLVNWAWIVAESPEIVALEIDLKSKNCATGATCSDGSMESLLIEATEYSLHLHPRRRREAWTQISFPRWPTWDIFAANIARYTLRVCLVK